MIKYCTVYSSNCIKFDTETEDITPVKPMRTHIDWHYYIDEDGEFKMDGKSQAVKKGDVVIKFYEDMDVPFIVIRSKEWKKAIEAYEKKEANKIAELTKKSCNECPCCDNCESAN